VTFQDWIGEPVNWAFAAVALVILFCALRVVTAHNVIHSALYLVGAMAGVAVMFLILGAEFLAWALVLVYIGAVLVLFLFGIMITRAPTGMDAGLSSSRKLIPALLAMGLFGLMSWASWEAFGTTLLPDVGGSSDTAVLGEALLGRFVIPFEVVGFILTAALIGGITISRRDLTPMEEEERQAV
jgi:NADH-quinone oxidoreductase subunit J